MYSRIWWFIFFFSGHAASQDFIGSYERLNHEAMRGEMSAGEFDTKWNLTSLQGNWTYITSEEDDCGTYSEKWTLVIRSSRDAELKTSIIYGPDKKLTASDCDYEGDMIYAHEIILDPAHGFMQMLVDTTEVDKTTLGDRKFGSWQLFSGKYLKLIYNAVGGFGSHQIVLERSQS